MKANKKIIGLLSMLIAVLLFSANTFAQTFSEKHYSKENIKAIHQEIKDHLNSLVTLTVKGNNVRVRSSPGTSYDVVEEVSQNDPSIKGYVAYKTTVKEAPNDKEWYRIVYKIIQQTETYYDRVQDMFIRSDFVKSAPSSKAKPGMYSDAEMIEGRIFNIHALNDLKRFTLNEPVTFIPESASPFVKNESNNILPAGTVIAFFGLYEFYRENSIPALDLLIEIAPDKAVRIGMVDLSELIKLNFGKKEKDIRPWLNSRKEKYKL